MSINKYFSFLICASLIFCSVATATETLKPGVKAPALDIEHWVSNGKGQFKQVESFEKGKVYVVEFWATWCPPCIASMPHLSELQKKYADKGLQIISISDEDLETVQKFLKGKVRGGDGETYSELTSTYCLTTDPDNSSHEAYMEAAGQDGIPAAFIIGKQGDVELICHPMELDEPLELIINDKWNREEFAKKQNAKKDAERKMIMELQEKMGEASQLIQQGDADEAIEIVEALIKKYESHPVAEQLKSAKAQMTMMAGGERGAKAMLDYAMANKDDAMLLNEIAWSVVEMKQAGEEVDEHVLGAAEKVAKQAVKSEPKNGAVLDTYAHLIYLNGDLDKAIEIQKKAVQNAGDMADQIQPFLDKLLKEKADQK